jgi:ABC-type transport system substrate-binding protein
VRQAIAHAVDRQALVERVLFGYGDARIFTKEPAL